MTLSLEFTPSEILQIRHFLADPSAFHLTELELRACSVVIMHLEGGVLPGNDYAAIVRHLLASTNDSN